jgi:hypothetical protein
MYSAAPDVLEEPPPFAGHQTAKRAAALLVAKDEGYHLPSRQERDALLIGFAMHRRVLYGAAFDVIRLSAPLDLCDPNSISSSIGSITVCEIKSTNRRAIKEDLKGYFFNITAAELLTAQSLGAQYRFLFVNTLTGEHVEMALNDVFGRARAMYPAWHIRF